MRAQLERLYRAAVEGVEPGRAVRSVLRREGDALSIAGRSVPNESRLTVLAIGKAAGAMARAVEAEAGARIRAGLVVSRDPLEAPLSFCAHMQAGHPVPDERSQAAAAAAISLVESMPPDDVLLVLLSGGASALLASPPEGVRVQELVDLTEALLASGADIAEMNTVRKQVSRVAGGRLAAAARANRIEVLLVSDVPGDRVDVIGSGPFAESETGYAEACGILRRRGLWERFPEIARDLEAGRTAEAERAPGPSEPGPGRVRHHVVARNQDAVDAAMLRAEQDFLRVLPLEGALSGEAREVGEGLASRVHTLDWPAGDSRPICLVGGGETTVTLQGEGRGGRNQELALAAAIGLDGASGVGLLAAGTDGIDGVTDAAGAFVDGGTVSRAEALGLQARDALDRNDSFGFFDTEGGVFRTGPSGTNVMDLVLICVVPNAES